MYRPKALAGIEARLVRLEALRVELQRNDWACIADRVAELSHSEGAARSRGMPCLTTGAHDARRSASIRLRAWPRSRGVLRSGRGWRGASPLWLVPGCYVWWYLRGLLAIGRGAGFAGRRLCLWRQSISRHRLVLIGLLEDGSGRIFGRFAGAGLCVLVQDMNCILSIEHPPART